jgi:hypothetical protein
MTISFGRAAAVQGKHGPRDYRVTLDGCPPTSAELVFMVGMVLLAEDRYDRKDELGRYMLFYFLDRLLHARSPEAVIEIAEDCAEAKDNPPRKVRVA